MIQNVSKWRVTFSFGIHREAVTIWLYDNNAGNILRQAAAMQFSENGLDQLTRIVMELCA